MTFATHLKMTFASIALISSFGMSPCNTAYAAPAADQISTSSAAQEFQVGSLYVEKYANPKAKGAPIILIPGLASGAYVWDETVKQLRNEHELYVVTLAGFSGKPAIAGPKLPKLKASLRGSLRSGLGPSLSQIRLWIPPLSSGAGGKVPIL